MRPQENQLSGQQDSRIDHFYFLLKPIGSKLNLALLVRFSGFLKSIVAKV